MDCSIGQKSSFSRTKWWPPHPSSLSLSSPPLTTITVIISNCHFRALTARRWAECRMRLLPFHPHPAWPLKWALLLLLCPFYDLANSYSKCQFGKSLTLRILTPKPLRSRKGSKSQEYSSLSKRISLDVYESIFHFFTCHERYRKLKQPKEDGQSLRTWKCDPGVPTSSPLRGRRLGSTASWLAHNLAYGRITLAAQQQLGEGTAEPRRPIWTA